MTDSARNGSLPPWLRDAPLPPAPQQAAVPRAATLPMANETPAMQDTPLPAWLTSGAALEPPAVRASDDLPDWLRTPELALPPLPSAPPPVAATGETNDDLPAWLRTSEPPRTDANPPAATDDLPDWLRVAEPPQQAVQQSSQQAAPIAPTPPQVAATSETNDDLPAWLRTSEPPRTDANPSAATDDLPDWLRVAEPPQQAAPIAPTPPPVVATSETNDDLPAWLRASEPPRTDANLPADDLPAWLRVAEPPQQAAPIAPTPPQVAATSETNDDLPAWLRASEPPRTDANVSAATDDLPAWLRVAEPPQQAAPIAPTPPQVAATSETNDDLPAWLRASEPPRADANPPAATDDLPAWLRVAEPPQQAAPVLPISPVPLPSTPQTERPDQLPPWLMEDAAQVPHAAGGEGNLPPWLRDAPTDVAPVAAISAPDTPLSTAATVAAVPAASFLNDLDVPAWLRAEQPRAATTPTESEVRSLDWLTRFGGTDDVGLSDIVAAPVTMVASPPLPVRTTPQLEATVLLKRLAETPPVSAPLDAAAPAPIWQRISTDLVLRIGLLLALLLTPLIVANAPELVAPLRQMPSSAGAQAMISRIDALGADDTVLIGYEWDIRRAGELRAIEQALLDQLVARQVKLVFLSTDLQGTMLQFDARDQLEAAGYRSGGEDYLMLGYRPGGELALRAAARDFANELRRDFNGNDATRSGVAADPVSGEPRLQTVRDFAMVIVIADELPDVQGWMEQVYPSLGGQVPLALVTPAEVAPAARPFTTQPDVFAVSGYADSLAYTAQRGVDPRGEERIVRLRIGLLAFGGLLLAGALVTIARRRIA